MNYTKIHDNIIMNARTRASSKIEARVLLGGYSECHHIVPRCMGGTNDKDNLVHLSAREHFIIHLLLVKIYPDVKKLLFAVRRLMHSKHRNDRLSGRSYESIKRSITDYQKTQNKENNEGLARSAEKQRGVPKPLISQALTGRTKETHEYLRISAAKSALSRTGTTKESNPNLASPYVGMTKDNCESIAKGALTRTGRTKETHEGIASAATKISKALAGRSKETHEYLRERGAKHSKCLMGRTKENDKGYAKLSELLSNRSKETHEGLAKSAEKQRSIPFSLVIELVKKRDSGMSGRKVHEWVLSLGYSIGYSTISAIYNSNKDYVRSINSQKTL